MGKLVCIESGAYIKEDKLDRNDPGNPAQRFAKFSLILLFFHPVKNGTIASSFRSKIDY
jgi:hypothetical protein